MEFIFEIYFKLFVAVVVLVVVGGDVFVVGYFVGEVKMKISHPINE